MAYRSALVHLSDLECGEKNRAARPPFADGYITCADKLIGDVKKQLFDDQKLAPSQVGLVITGDIANKGQEEEYREARKVIEYIRDALGIPSKQVAIVPGNHDVNWADCKKAFGDNYPNDSCDDPKARQKVRDSPAKFNGFRQFLTQVCKKEFPKSETVLAFDDFRDLGVALVGFDTTYPCTFHEDDNYGLMRDKPIRDVGRKELERLLDGHDRLIPIAMLHHCPNPLRDQTEGDNSYLKNGSEALEWLRKAGFSVILSGHEHQAKTIVDLRLGDQVLVTGSYGLNAEELMNRYHGSPRIESNKYQIVLVNPEGTSEILLRKLRDPGAVHADWVPDNDDGIARIPIPLRRSQLCTAGPDSLERQVSLLISHPVLLPVVNRWVVSMSIGVPERRLKSIKSVTYEVCGQSTCRENRADRFFGDSEIDDLQCHVEAHIATEDEGSITISSEIPPPA